MKNLIEKYYKMSNDEKEDLEILYIIDVIECQSSYYSELDISFEDIEILVEIIENLLALMDKSIYELVGEIFELLDRLNISIKQLEKLDINLLVQLLSDNKNNKDFTKKFTFENFKCYFSKNDDLYIIVCVKGDHTHIILYESFEDIIADTIKYNLLIEEHE